MGCNVTAVQPFKIRTKEGEKDHDVLLTVVAILTQDKDRPIKANVFYLAAGPNNDQRLIRATDVEKIYPE